jgi:tetraacyldisaccharide 4'-kinase
MSDGPGGFIERWWAGEAGRLGAALDVALLPAEAVFRLASRLRCVVHERGLLPAKHAGVPVISVGNLVVGGAGKTPVARWIVDQLLELGRRPALLHGGYGADEPELHRHWHPAVPVVAARNRVRSAAVAVDAGADVIVLDDGFQHLRLHRDLDLVLVPAEGWSREPRLLPRGPWRELPAALQRADAVAITRRTADDGEAAQVRAEVAAIAAGAVCFDLALVADGWADREGTAAEAPAGGVLAVAAIARPALFLRNAAQAGAEVEDVLVFRDHHDYTPADLGRLRERAAGRTIVTTEKDWVKLARIDPGLDLRVLRQRVEARAGADAFLALLERLGRRET